MKSSRRHLRRKLAINILPSNKGIPLVVMPKYIVEGIAMQTKSITIKNVSQETVAMLRDIRIDERRQLSAILEDCVQAYWEVTYEDDYSSQLAIAVPDQISCSD